MEVKEAYAVDHQIFLNYEKNLLRSMAEKEFLTITTKEGTTRKLFCSHRHWYGKYSFQDASGGTPILLELPQIVQLEI
ncbi:MAG: hypothetical protein AABZ60_22555 [Planctomycetota bacterium]